MSNVFENNLPHLLSLGFAFHGKAPRKAADPERAVLDLLPAFFEDRKLFRMLLTWLDVVSDLIHVERLETLAETLPPNLKLVLAAVALKLSARDRRWKRVCTRLRNQLGKTKSAFVPPTEYQDTFLISKHGIDPEFQILNIKIANLLPESEKKILPLPAILEINSWLRLRALMGANFRADVAHLYLSKQVDGPADAARKLGCARDTAYRNWRSLEDARARTLVRA